MDARRSASVDDVTRAYLRVANVQPGRVADDTDVGRTRHFERTGVRTTNLASTSASKVADYRVPLRTLEEQRKAVRAYARSARVLGLPRKQITRQLDLLAEHRKALIPAAVTGGLDVARGIAEAAAS